ncbi:MAG: DUF1822 family protein [Crocinitomicaceae bacterium]|nr:DUF1822 family protein [Crocinitomicaceae bacterium]
MTFLFAEPTQLWLEISPKDQSSAWEQSQTLCASSSRWRAYINQLCRSTFIRYLQEEYPQANIPRVNLETHLGLWDVVNGSMVNLGDKKLILLPTEASDDEELQVPQEWIDIPRLVGDYYLAVQVNPDEQWIRIWGYTTHHKLKNQGHYEPLERTYSLDINELIKDINVFFVSQELSTQETTREVITTLPSLPLVQAENLTERLGNSDSPITRLSIPFSLWGALLENENWTQKLYQKRQSQRESSNTLINLSRWLDNIFDAVWQSPQELDLAFETRRNAQVQGSQIKRGTVIFVEASSVERQAVILLIGITRETDERIGVRIQLYPHGRDRYLPSNITLTLCAESGEPIQSVQARNQDNYIQIKRFKCPSGFQFGVQLTLDDWTVTESFIV